MADFRPLRGVHYDWAQLDDPADVVAPPYDVIDDAQQAALYARHPWNVIRLILNHHPLEGPHNRYDDAAQHFTQWRHDGVLTQEDTPALYVYHQTFHHPDHPSHVLTRRGVMGRVRLHPYEDRVVLPHELTLRGPKVDRLRLNEGVQANLSQVFFLYDDPQQRADQALDSAIKDRTPDLTLTTHDNVEHRLWTVTDPEVIETVQAVIEHQQLLIADGHHRYETNLALRDRAIEASAEGLADNDPRRFVLAFLANSADPGLLVLPTHRIIRGFRRFNPSILLDALASDFVVTPLDDVDQVDALAARVTAMMDEHIVFGVVVPGTPRQFVLVHRHRDEPSLVAGMQGPKAMQELDLIVLHEVIFKRYLGMTDDDFAHKRFLGYAKSLAAAQTALEEPETQALVIVNHSPVAQVREVCQAGGKMPQKSTFFHPKVLSGLVFHSFDDTL